MNRWGQAEASDDDDTAPPSLAVRLDLLERHRSADVRWRLDAARTAEAEAAETGDHTARMRARLVTADMLHRVGKGEDAARLAVDVNTWAAAHGPAPLLARSHLVLSSVVEGIGDASGALDHAVRANDLLADDASPRELGVYRMRLADTLALTGSTDAARERYQEAQRLFTAIGDTERVLTVLNNLSVMEYENGNTAAARAVAEHLFRYDSPGARNPASADTVARARLLARDVEGAEAAVQEGLRLLAAHGDTQASTPAELALTHAEILLSTGRLDEAESALFHCLDICTERGLAGIRVQALGVRAELLAARRDFEGAYNAHRTFHVEYRTLRARQQDAAARTRQALFETAEARRQAQQFWLQARTDPLTGLYNRRYLDEELPRYLEELVGSGATLVAAIIDLDHFKRINDTHSHEVGDEVLRRLATRLRDLPTDDAASADSRFPGFAARLGGEEFAVLQVTDRETAVARLEALRTAFARASWSGLPDGLAVTLSAGAAVATAEDTQTTLLRRADDHLYAAKAAGRDRVVADPPA